MYILNRENLVILALLIVIVLNIILLSTDNYFSLKSLNSVEFGITGAVIQGTHYSYYDILDACTLRKYCDYISDFQKSGMIVQALVAIDIVILATIIISSVLLTILLRKAVAKKETLSRFRKAFLKTLTYGKKILFLHPILLNMGIVMWIVMSKLDKHSKDIVLHEGLIILFIQCFLSLLSIAYNVWMISSTRRKNIRLLRAKTYNKEDLSFSI
ncbi:hypothetical protein SteCoe_15026 [Stentor coeruleus]|uniref:Uncharacterized protein n=1 Tax=Stentor coeruleus TaxID=5963 RepID=A0A1R2C4N1_9CILI|nr:hypothetical protein SteCoe_15026 [Stentor coeruleus]